MSVLDELVLVAKVCAVTAYELTIKLTKDGRARGLWVFFEDYSRERSESDLSQFEESYAKFKAALVKEGVITKEAAKKQDSDIRMYLTLYFQSFLRMGYEPQGALMEWPEALEFYEAMGKEIAKARKRGDLPK